MLALILVCLGDPLIVPKLVPTATTPADLKRAEAMAEGFKAQFPNAFPGGSSLATPQPQPQAGDVWTRSGRNGSATATKTVTVSPRGLKFTILDTDPTGVTHSMTLLADATRNGPNVYGVITRVECENTNPKTFALEGAPFAATVQVVDGKLWVGRIRCEAGDSGVDLTLLFSGSYESPGALKAGR